MPAQGVSRHQNSLNFKNVSNRSEGGGAAFFKNVSNSKMSQMSEGGSALIGTLSQILPFFLVTPPLMLYWGFDKNQSERSKNKKMAAQALALP